MLNYIHLDLQFLFLFYGLLQEMIICPISHCLAGECSWILCKNDLAVKLICFIVYVRHTNMPAKETMVKFKQR